MITLSGAGFTGSRLLHLCRNWPLIIQPIAGGAGRRGHRVVDYPCTPANSPLTFASPRFADRPEGRRMESPKRWLGCQPLTLPAPRMLHGANIFGRCAPPLIPPPARYHSRCPAAARPSSPHRTGASVARCGRWMFTTIQRNHRPHARQTVSVHFSFNHHRQTTTGDTMRAARDDTATPPMRSGCATPHHCFAARRDDGPAGAVMWRRT